MLSTASQGGLLFHLEVRVLRFRAQDSGLVLSRSNFEGIAKGPCESHMKKF